jgi:hypothetical protein
MEANVRQAFKAEFEKLRQEIIARYEQSGMKAGGSWANTVQVQELPNGFTIVADSYINGRGPGKAPPSEAIEQWIKRKGISARIKGDISTGSLAYLIARKIARQGWKPKKGNEDIAGQVATPQRIQQIMDAVAPVYAENFARDISALLEKTFA